MRRKHVYKVDKLVIGSDLAALMYAFLSNSTFIFDKVIQPITFEYLPINFPVSMFNHEPTITRRQTANGFVEFGTPKIEIWNKLIFIMSSTGLLPFGTKEVTIRQQDELLAVKTKSRNYYYEVSEIERIKNTYSKYRVYDWVDIRSCGLIGLEYIETDDRFVNEIFFYPSDRNGTHKSMLDIFTISQLTESQLDDFDFGETMVRLRVTSLLKELGIRGPRNGKNPTYPRSSEKYKYAPIKLEHNYREIRAIKTNNSEQDIVDRFLKENKLLPEDSYLYRFSERVSSERLSRIW